MVSQKKRLSTLLEEERPSVEKRDGGTHYFEKDHLTEVENIVPIHKKKDLQLPIVVYNDPSLDRCYVKGKVEGKVVKEMIGLKNKTIQKEKNWFSKPLTADMIREYDDIFLFVWTPKLNEGISTKKY